MAQHSLSDRVAIISMGCTRFAEHFDQSADGLAVDAVTEALDGAGLTSDDVDAFWLGTHVSGIRRSPRAQFRKAVSKEAVERPPAVAGELGVLDCSGVADGAAAAIVTRAEDAHKYTSVPLYIKALSLVTGNGSGAADPHYDYTSFPEVVECAQRAYAQAGITDPVRQLALAEVHDCFTPTEIVLMEDLGFATRGGAWRDVLDGVYDRDGALPVNPDGGLKSFGHPVGARGLRMIYECWLQLRGQAGARQLATAHRGLALTQNLGGAPGDCVCFVSVVGTEPG